MRVLPDMRGISATFDISTLPILPPGTNELPLVIWTQFGDAKPRLPVKITGRRDAAGCKDEGRAQGAARSQR